MRTRNLLIIAMAAATSLHANSYFMNGPVQSQVDAQGLGADACQYAGVTLMRYDVVGQLAIQVGGSLPNDPSRIFTKPGTGSFFLTDVGSQWSSVVARFQTALAVVETIAGQHAWNGSDYAGASTVTLAKMDIIAGSVALPNVLMTKLPSVQLIQGSPTAMVLSVPPAIDPSGQADGLRVWKKPMGNAATPWSLVQDLPWDASNPQWVTDTAVVDGEGYQYGLSLIYRWPGGRLGTGASDDIADHYVTKAMGRSGPYFASLIQPTPTPFPTLVPPIATPSIGEEAWVAYPNPLVGSELHLAFKTEKDKSNYKVAFYSIDGTLALSIQGQAETAGWQKPTLDLGKLAPGVYLSRLRIFQPGIDEKLLPVRKLAIIK
jgi:hypothetical protein